MAFVPTREHELINELGICGCGNPEEAYEAVHDMLKRAVDPERFDNKDKWLIPECEYDCYIAFMCYTLNDKEFMEHGSSIYGSFLTSKGKLLLNAMNEFEKYEYDWESVQYDMPNMFYVEEGVKGDKDELKD